MISRLSAILLFSALALPFAACADDDASNNPNNGGGTGGDTGADYIPETATCEKLVLSPKEQAIYDRIMVEREKVGMPAIPASVSLMHVARTHAGDSAAHQATAAKECNLHSWSNKGSWSVCCYTSDHANAKCMWDKPKELTNFKVTGYEISAMSSSSETDVVDMWMGSPGHHDVMLNAGVWSNVFKSIGIGTTGDAESGYYTHVWFAVESECP